MHEENHSKAEELGIWTSFIVRRGFERVQHGLQIELGAADDLEQLACRRLLLQRLAQLAAELRGFGFLTGRSTAFGASRSPDVTALRRSDLAGWPPALERRLIAFPKAQNTGQISTQEVARHALKYGMFAAIAPAASARCPRCVEPRRA
jgi:hypothetical protein